MLQMLQRTRPAILIFLLQSSIIRHVKSSSKRLANNAMECSLLYCDRPLKFWTRTQLVNQMVRKRSTMLSISYGNRAHQKAPKKHQKAQRRREAIGEAKRRWSRVRKASSSQHWRRKSETGEWTKLRFRTSDHKEHGEPRFLHGRQQHCRQ